MPSSAIPSSSSSSSHSSASSVSFSANSLNTPDSSTCLSPSHSILPCDIDPPKLHLHLSTSCPQITTIKDLPAHDAAPRNKHTPGLVDQAVKSLCEIWRPQDIPSVFLSSASTGGLVSLSTSLDHTRLTHQHSSSNLTERTAQLSTVFPTASSMASTNAVPSITSTAPLQSADTDAEMRTMAVPIKGFVHEVFGDHELQGMFFKQRYAIWRLFAQRFQKLELRIRPATEAELAQEQAAELSADVSSTIQDADAVMDTIRVSDSSSEHQSLFLPSNVDLLQQSLKATKPVTPLPRLPTPLLCPRRAFLAALILASKFTQDKCYSNRAWAKLSGLPAREIGRCERALGDALDWRLWVGKSSSSATSQRSMTRSSSEASLFQSTASSLIGGERKTVVSAPADDAPSSTRRLRKCVTLPAEAFSTSKPISARSRALREKFLPSAGLPCDRGFGADSQSVAGAIALPVIKLSASSESNLGLLAAPSVIPSRESLCPPNMISLSFKQGFSEKVNPSPSPDTPGLSYSPCSTESTSGGDRTVQMSTFLDDTMGTFNTSQSWVSADCSWQQLEETANFSAHAVGQVQCISEKKMAIHSAPDIYTPDSPPSMFMTSLDTLLSKPGIYGPDMRGSYPREREDDYLTVGLSLNSD
ncbi:hypothetical protein BDQ17DRAFT_1420869 [Cyathus striatus]|nr:hypothetical protein BDQ17DRAFT_1420869 [Cyathus striatus]